MGNQGSAESSSEETPPNSEEEFRRLSYWEMAKYGYQELVNAIIRPPRASYDRDHLGPEYFEWHGRSFQRKDMELINPRGHRLQCSHWTPQHDSSPRPCLVYMHGNASARVEGISQLALCLSIGITLFAFDFSGSGQSDGDYVSLGYWEREDLATVIAHLRASGHVSSIALWGRSMGAVTGLLHSSRDPSIAAMVCDGAFADLTQLAEELVEKAKQSGLAVPGFVVSIAIRMIRSSVFKTAHFKLEDVAPVKEVHASFVPTLFVAGDADDFVMPHHSQQIHDNYAGDKNFVVVEGDHNSPRPRFLFDSAAIFLQNYMHVPLSWVLPGADAFNNGVPPWIIDHVGLNLADLGIDLNDLDLSAENENQFGMTRDRQMHVQRTLNNVFGGGAGSSSSEAAATTPASSAAAAGGGTSSSSSEQPPDSQRRPQISASSGGSLISSLSASSTRETTQPPDRIVAAALPPPDSGDRPPPPPAPKRRPPRS